MKEGIAIINLVDKFRKENVKNGEVYYLITYNLEKALTKKYLELNPQLNPETLKSNKKPLFLFNEKKKFAYHLAEGKVYFVEYSVNQKSKQVKYFHVKDWRILGDKLSIERSWNLLLEKNIRERKNWN